MNLALIIIIYLICSTFGLALLKTSLPSMELSSISSYVKLLFNYRFVTGFFLYGCSFLVWLVMLSKKDLSYIYPIVIGLGYLCIMLTAAFILKENFSFNKILGVILVGIGIVIIISQK